MPFGIQSAPAFKAELNVQIGKTSVEDLQTFAQTADGKGGGQIGAKQNKDGSFTLYVRKDSTALFSRKTFAPAEKAESQALAKDLMKEIISRRLPAEKLAGTDHSHGERLTRGVNDKARAILGEEGAATATRDLAGPATRSLLSRIDAGGHTSDLLKHLQDVEGKVTENAKGQVLTAGNKDHQTALADLRGILENPSLRDAFQGFMKTKFVGEVADFLSRKHDFDALPAGPPAAKMQMAEAIFRDLIESPEMNPDTVQINLGKENAQIYGDMQDLRTELRLMPLRHEAAAQPPELREFKTSLDRFEAAVAKDFRGGHGAEQLTRMAKGLISDMARLPLPEPAKSEVIARAQAQLAGIEGAMEAFTDPSAGQLRGIFSEIDQIATPLTQHEVAHGISAQGEKKLNEIFNGAHRIASGGGEGAVIGNHKLPAVLEMFTKSPAFKAAVTDLTSGGLGQAARTNLEARGNAITTQVTNLKAAIDKYVLVLDNHAQTELPAHLQQAYDELVNFQPGAKDAGTSHLGGMDLQTYVESRKTELKFDATVIKAKSASAAEMMADPIMREGLRTFMKAEFNIENFDFLEGLETFSASAHSGQVDPRSLLQEAKTLQNDFIRRGAAAQVNLPGRYPSLISASLNRVEVALGGGADGLHQAVGQFEGEIAERYRGGAGSEYLTRAADRLIGEMATLPLAEPGKSGVIAQARSRLEAIERQMSNFVDPSENQLKEIFAELKAISSPVADPKKELQQTFNEAERAILNLVDNDTKRRFVQTPEFDDLVRAKIQARSDALEQLDAARASRVIPRALEQSGLA